MPEKFLNDLQRGATHDEVRGERMPKDVPAVALDARRLIRAPHRIPWRALSWS